MAELSGTAKCVKYTLFVFNLLFLLAGLALIIVGAVVQVQTSKGSFNGAVSGAGIFIIVIGSIVFLVCFFGCAGAINNNYCMVVTYGVLLLIILLAQVAAVITGFVLRNQVTDAINKQMLDDLTHYRPKNVDAQVWDETQASWNCCGVFNYTDWNQNNFTKETNSVPDSCCIVKKEKCGEHIFEQPDISSVINIHGCGEKIVAQIKKYMIAVGAVAAAVALLEIIGIVFAFCFAASLRKDYRVV